MLSDKYNSKERDVINLISDIMDMKTSLVDYVTSQYSSFDINDTYLQELSDQFIVMRERSKIVIDESEKACADLLLSTEEREIYKRQIKNLLDLRTAVVDLIDLDTSVRNFQEFKNSIFELSVDNLKKLSSELISLRKLLEKSSFTIRVQDNKVYQTLIRSHLETKSDLMAQLKEMWNSKIVIERNRKHPKYDYEIPSNNKNLIPISKSIIFNMSTDILRELISLMYNLDIGSEKLLLVMTFITEELLYPFIGKFNQYSLTVSTDDNKLCIFLHSMLPEEKLTVVDQAIQFMDSLTAVLHVLYTDILSIAHNDVQTQLLVSEIEKTMLGDKLIDNIVTHFMPELFEVHEKMTEKLLQFNDTLIKYRCIQRDNVRLTKYIANFQYHIGKHEENKMLSCCRFSYLQSMLKFTKLKGNIYEPYEELWCDYYVTACSKLSKFIDVTNVAFPYCHVSDIAIEVMSLIGNHILYLFSDDNNTRIEVVKDSLRTLPDMMSMYLSVVPVSNYRELETIPQAAALHYNNCMFIAHHCMVISPSIKSRVDRMIITNELDQVVFHNAPISILKLVYVLRDAASEALTKEFDKQKTQLQEFFDEVDTFVGIDNKLHRAKIEKMLKKCIMHLHLLSDAYIVLPLNIYDSFFGGLLMNEALSMVLTRVMAMEDIVHSDNREIVSVINDLCLSMTDVITKHYSAHNCLERDIPVIEVYMLENIPHWSKVQSLLFVLKSSLVEIEDRYADGKGPLTDVFTGAELRSLIKALFRSSQMRARVLEKIN